MADKKTIDYYNSNATCYGNVEPDPNGSFVQYRNSFIDKLPTGCCILDLGCGGGHSSLAFIEHGFDLVALDGSTELARIASQRINTDVLVQDFSDLDFQSEFNGIWAAASLTHLSLDTLNNVMERVCTALQPQGLLCASFKCSETDWRDAEGRFYSAITPDTLRRITLSGGLQVNAIELVQGKGSLNDPTTWAWLTATRS